jgi:hypothetical protein
MSKEKNITEEQKICISCGLCCDGTLFDKAVLQEGEKSTLPQKMKNNYFRTKNKEFFRQPCPYFSGKCMIYYQNKADICSAFRCRLLNDYYKKILNFSETDHIIRQAKILREEIFILAREVFNIDYNLPFKEILKKMNERNQDKLDVSFPILEALKVKCYILEILLIKHFKPKKDFMAMITTLKPKEAETNNI